MHNSFAMLRIAQWLSKNHAHSLPLQGTSMIIPSILTAGPNFMGHVFRDGIQKSWLYLKESFLQSWLASHHTIRLERQYYNYKRFWHYHCFPEGLLKEWGTPHSHRKFLPVSLGINQPDWDVFFIRCARIRTGRYYDTTIFETRG